jgi:uncharacterized membrane protein YfcA
MTIGFVLVGEVMVTATLGGGGTMPLPPFAQPPASARLNNAIANRMFFVMMISSNINSEPNLFGKFQCT